MAILEAATALNTQPWTIACLPETATAYCWVVWALTLREAKASAEQQIAKRQQQHGRRR